MIGMAVGFAIWIVALGAAMETWELLRKHWWRLF